MKLFTAVLLPEAREQLKKLPSLYKKRIATAIATFELIGTGYKSINSLGNGLYEIKPSGVRAYFKYDAVHRHIIVVGFICLKKGQKAPPLYIREANRLIDAYMLGQEGEQ